MIAAVVAEVIDERGAHVGGARTSYAVGALMAFDPRLVNRLGLSGPNSSR